MTRVPMRWPTSPAEYWNRPESLALLSGTPINCIVLSPGSAEAERQPLIERAIKMGMVVVGESDIPWVNQSGIPPSSKEPFIALSKAVWPSVRAFGRGDGSSAGPTGNAWIDSNGWLVRLARERAPGKPVWLTCVPPAKADMLRPESYTMAVADAAAYGARWIVSLDDGLSAGVARGDSRAQDTWKRLTSSIAFFERHSGWTTFSTVANLGVLSDFAGENESFACEVLNLCARRHQLHRILLKRRAATDSYDGLAAIVYADRTPPENVLWEKLLAFAEAGGLLVAPTAWRSLVSGGTVSEYPRHSVFTAGKGRIAIATKPPTDAYLLAADTQLILSRGHDLLRVWNGGSLNVHVTASKDGRQGLVQVLNYASRPPEHQASVQLKERYGSARLLRIEGGEEEMTMVPAKTGIELHLPAFPVYAAIELTK